MGWRGLERAGLQVLLIGFATSGAASAFTIASCRRATTSRGVAAGAKAPIQNTYSELGKPSSRVVGISGTDALRRTLLTASVRS